MALSAIDLLKRLHTAGFGADSDGDEPSESEEATSQFIEDCMQRLSESTFALKRDDKLSDSDRKRHTLCIERCLVLLEEYVTECDEAYPRLRQ